jgi:hypothetical protein
MFNCTINEYVHEDFSILGTDAVVIYYEPLDNRSVISISGTIYIDGREVTAFQGGNGLIIPEGSRDGKPCVLAGNFGSANGIITLVWDRHPGEHFLCVSYDFAGSVEEVPFTSSNWLKDGF